MFYNILTEGNSGIAICIAIWKYDTIIRYSAVWRYVAPCIKYLLRIDSK